MAGKNDTKETVTQDIPEVKTSDVTTETPVVEEVATPKQEYVAPAVKDLSKGKQEDKQDPKKVVGVGGGESVPKVVMREATFRQAEGVIAISRMVNAKGTASTDVILARIEKHMKHLSGQLGFKDETEKLHEQLSFIETIGNTLRLDFPQYALVTDVLLSNIKANQSVFDKGLAFRFVASLGKAYPTEHVKTYQSYMSFLAVIAKNWSTRNKLKNLVDVGYVTKDFPQKAKENVSQYFRHVISG